LVDEPVRVRFNSGGDVTVTDRRFLDGFVVTNGTRVTMRNCHVISPDSFWTIRVYDGGSLLMEDCQIGDYETTPGERGVGGDNVTLRRVKIVGHTDGIKAGTNSLYERVWVTDLRDAGPGHEDGLQDDGGNTNYTIRYSRIEGLRYPSGLGNAAMIIKSDLGSISNVTIEHNAFDGGNYVLMLGVGDYPPPYNVVIRNNAFGRNFRYGVFLQHDGVGFTWENNFWEDTGEYIDDGGHVIGGATTTTTTPPPTTTTTSKPPTTTTPPPTTTTTSKPPTTTTQPRKTTTQPGASTTTTQPSKTTTQPGASTTAVETTGTIEALEDSGTTRPEQAVDSNQVVSPPGTAGEQEVAEDAGGPFNGILIATALAGIGLAFVLLRRRI
jgi:hypothetical protein